MYFVLTLKNPVSPENPPEHKPCTDNATKAQELNSVLQNKDTKENNRQTAIKQSKVGWD